MLQQGKTQAKKAPAKTKTARTQSTKSGNGKSTSRKKQTAPMLISSQQRQQMINEAAYYLAQSRGFVGGNPVDDWLAAEAQVDLKLSQTGK